MWLKFCCQIVFEPFPTVKQNFLHLLLVMNVTGGVVIPVLVPAFVPRVGPAVVVVSDGKEFKFFNYICAKNTVLPSHFVITMCYVLFI